VSTHQHESTFPRKRKFTTILNIRYKLLIYNNNLRDGWPPNSWSKYLFQQQFFLSVSADAPRVPPPVVGCHRTLLGIKSAQLSR
jgi:hypothetical protein